jgi:hypothetical protein
MFETLNKEDLVKTSQVSCKNAFNLLEKEIVNCANNAAIKGLIYCIIEFSNEKYKINTFSKEFENLTQALQKKGFEVDYDESYIKIRWE